MLKQLGAHMSAHIVSSDNQSKHSLLYPKELEIIKKKIVLFLIQAIKVNNKDLAVAAQILDSSLFESADLDDNDSSANEERLNVLHEILAGKVVQVKWLTSIKSIMTESKDVLHEELEMVDERLQKIVAYCR